MKQLFLPRETFVLLGGNICFARGKQMFSRHETADAYGGRSREPWQGEGGGAVKKLLF